MAQTSRDGEIVLTVPRPVGAGETVFVEVQVGAVPRGRSVEVTTAAGRSLGVIKAFGVRPGQDTGTHALPVPSSAIQDGRLALRLRVRQGDKLTVPTADEVRGVKLNIVGAR